MIRDLNWKENFLYDVLKVQVNVASYMNDYGPVAQLVRASPCHGEGRGFESLLGRSYGILAQLGEHLPYKQRVTGSSPVGPIFYADMAQLAEQLICNQQVNGSSPFIGFVCVIADTRVLRLVIWTFSSVG